MPRKTRQPTTSTKRTWTGFNEAAARCRGKQAPPEEAPPEEADASMRPRPDAAENMGGEALTPVVDTLQ